MKTIEELHEFYRTELYSELVDLEEHRKTAARNSIIANIAIFIFIGILPIILIGFVVDERDFKYEWMFAPPIIAIIAGFGATKYFSQYYVGEFKHTVIENIIHFIEPNLTYSPNSFVPRYHFTGSDIFGQETCSYFGDDMVYGMIDKTKVCFSEVIAKEEYYRTKDGERKEKTYFKGLFFVADFNKEFYANTYVLPDTAERFLGRLGKTFQSLNKFRGQLVKLEDPEFEKYFVVYSQDQIESRYILTPLVMRRLTEFRKKTGKKIYASFKYGNLYVAIKYNRNLFEPRLFTSMLDFKPIKEYYEDLQLAIGIVEQLKLNTRIWTKK